MIQRDCSSWRWLFCLDTYTTPTRIHAAADDILPFAATETTLPNGLKVIVVPTGFRSRQHPGFPCRWARATKSRPASQGRAFFEHLMFRGTPNTPPEKYRDIMSKAGARDNADSNNRTTFYATFAKEHLEEVVGLYADMFQHLSYPEADFKTEARAILAS